MPTDSDLRDALRDCFDPVERRDLVSLNLLRAATLTEDATVPGAGIPGVPSRFVAHVTLLQPSADEAHMAALRGIVENRLLGLPWISRVELRMVPNPLPILR